ncbi:hypothetical protein BT96DRAFT_705233 [Gymnopus androsaceus JB14]|uniref:Uncharacterized protein n=1 Tax=Gymnopus androsaceus JB14 TaxID=1447944 RepID=A0A6A4GER1_9AGAR|nr:hypothetical protein BT96DRAFT_705233 [Gymnopus androsaceus JB14]
MDIDVFQDSKSLSFPTFSYLPDLTLQTVGELQRSMRACVQSKFANYNQLLDVAREAHRENVGDTYATGLIFFCRRRISKRSCRRNSSTLLSRKGSDNLVPWS